MTGRETEALGASLRPRPRIDGPGIRRRCRLRPLIGGLSREEELWARPPLTQKLLARLPQPLPAGGPAACTAPERCRRRAAVAIARV